MSQTTPPSIYSQIYDKYYAVIDTLENMKPDLPADFDPDIWGEVELEEKFTKEEIMEAMHGPLREILGIIPMDHIIRLDNEKFRD